MTRALVPIADGCEEMEAVIIIDTLRRAEWEVVVAGLRDGAVTASRGVRLVPERDLDDVAIDAFDLIVLPGGLGGMEALRADDRILDAVRRMHGGGKIVSAICAAPLVLQAAGILDGVRATCHPSVREQMTSAVPVDEPVVIDGTIVTSRGPGTAFLFALALIELIDDAAKADAIANAMLVVRH